MLNGFTPFSNGNCDEPVDQIWQKILECKKVDIPLQLKKDSKALLEGMLKINPDHRFTIQQLIKHPYFKFFKPIVPNQPVAVGQDNSLEGKADKYLAVDNLCRFSHYNCEIIKVWKMERLKSLRNTLANAELLAPISNAVSEIIPQQIVNEVVPQVDQFKNAELVSEIIPQQIVKEVVPHQFENLQENSENNSFNANNATSSAPILSFDSYEKKPRKIYKAATPKFQHKVKVETSNANEQTKCKALPKLKPAVPIFPKRDPLAPRSIPIPLVKTVKSRWI